ncbi:MAG: FAD-dependent oxidoreductase [Geminicoccaceae bacterium]
MTFHDARALDDGAVLDADLCIVGSGPAGLAIAHALKDSGMRIILLESGGHGFHHRPQFLYAGELSGAPNYALTHARFRQYGGSTTRWMAQCVPLDRIDLSDRPWISESGWPITFDDLAAWYDDAARFCQLTSTSFAVEPWVERAGPALPLEGDDFSTGVIQFGYPRDLGQSYRATLDAAGNIDVFLFANVVALETNAAATTVRSVRVQTFAGTSWQCRARDVVLACGGIENARLLLASNRIAPNGLGNVYDQVGRYFMDHPYLTTGFFEPSDAVCARGLHVIEHHDGQDFGLAGKIQQGHAVYGLSAALQRRAQVNNVAGYFIRTDSYRCQPAYFARGGAALSYFFELARHQRMPDGELWSRTGDLFGDPGSALATLNAAWRERRQPDHKLALRTIVETTPNAASRVTLGDRRDALGMPRVKVHWQINEDDKRGLALFRARLAATLAERGLGRLIDDPSENVLGWPVSFRGGKHHIGTTRMHDDPKRGVVDRHCRVHGMSNLHIAGSSVFTTGGWANPTLTIVALALRLAARLRQHGVAPARTHRRATEPGARSGMMASKGCIQAPGRMLSSSARDGRRSPRVGRA